MSINLIGEFIREVVEDYEKNGKGKPVNEWLKEAIKRHIIDISDEDIENIANGIMSGIKAYREQKVKLKEKEALKIENEEIKEEVNLLIENVVEDLNKTLKSRK